MRITLEAARVNVGLKQSEAAAKIGVNKKTLSSWERGKSIPKSDKIPIICAVYNRHYDEIKWGR